MSIGKLALWLAVLCATGCATTITLTSGGNLVQQVPSTDIPPGCNLLGDVPIGIPPDAARPRTEEQLVILMRNKTSEMGGNRVIIDTSEQSGSGPEAFWHGRGVAYACSEADLAPPRTPPEEPAAPPEGEEGATAGGEEEAAAPAEEEEPEEEPAPRRRRH